MEDYENGWNRSSGDEEHNDYGGHLKVKRPADGNNSRSEQWKKGQQQGDIGSGAAPFRGPAQCCAGYRRQSERKSSRKKNVWTLLEFKERRHYEGQM